MGSPVSPIVANLYMEYFEQKALTTAVLTCLYNLQWKTTRRMVPFPSWIPL